MNNNLMPITTVVASVFVSIVSMPAHADVLEFAGTIGKTQPIEMVLERNGAQFSGCYHYGKTKKPVMLSGKMTSTNKVVINEVNTADNVTARFAGEIQGDKQFIGEWSTSDNKDSMPFQLYRAEVKNLKCSHLESNWQGAWTTDKLWSQNTGSSFKLDLKQDGSLIEGGISLSLPKGPDWTGTAQGKITEKNQAVLQIKLSNKERDDAIAGDVVLHFNGKNIDWAWKGKNPELPFITKMQLVKTMP